jgi:hypothetical protein
VALVAVVGCSSDGGDEAAYCEATVALATAADPVIDSTASEAQQQAALRSYGAQLAPLAAQLRASAPNAIDDDAAVLADAVDDLARSGDPGALSTGAVSVASEHAHGDALDRCGWARRGVIATDYAFDGLPAVIEPGIVSFEISNRGTEPHELLLKEGQEVVARAIVDPGGRGFVVADLGGGTYEVVCTLPLGSTTTERGTGPPHETQGMRAEVRVT